MKCRIKKRPKPTLESRIKALGDKINNLNDYAFEEPTLEGRIKALEDKVNNLIDYTFGDHSNDLVLYPEFSKVPFEQFVKDVKKFDTKYNDDNESTYRLLKEIYDNIKIPSRSTVGSAGYDFASPFSFSLNRNRSTVIPTGIRCSMPDFLFLQLVPRSGLGFKYRVSLANTVGIIDADYFNADNYGHIMVKLVYDGFSEQGITIGHPERDALNIEAGSGICKGIFTYY